MWSRGPPIRTYYSRTQLLLVNGPLVWSLVALGVAQRYFQHPPLPVLAAISLFSVLSFLWMFIGRALTNSAYESGTHR